MSMYDREVIPSDETPENALPLYSVNLELHDPNAEGGRPFSTHKWVNIVPRVGEVVNYSGIHFIVAWIEHVYSSDGGSGIIIHCDMLEDDSEEGE